MSAKVLSMGARMVARAGDQAFERLSEGGADSMIARAQRLARTCRERGEVGLLAVDDYPDSGRVMVPTSVLNDLLAVVSARMVKP